MNRGMLDHSHRNLTEGLAEALRVSREPASVYLAWQQLIDAAGFRHWAHLSFDDGGKPIIQSNYPTIWLQRYLDENYLSIDPIIAEASTAKVPYLWHEAACKTQLSRRQQQFFDEAGSYGLNLGAGIPLWNAPGRQGLVSLVPHQRKRNEFERHYQHTRIDLLAAANLLHQHVVRLRHQQIRARVALTTRERDCLDLLLQGLTTAQLAHRLGLTERGIQFHVENLKAKFGVKTRLQLLARFI